MKIDTKAIREQYSLEKEAKLKDNIVKHYRGIIDKQDILDRNYNKSRKYIATLVEEFNKAIDEDNDHFFDDLSSGEDCYGLSYP